MHWDGSIWSIVPSPGQGFLHAVEAISSNDVWAVGSYYSNQVERGEILHWDGNVWRVVATPNPDVGRINAVTAVSSNDVWAVGYNYSNQTARVEILHWNGSEWSLVPAPDLGQGTLGAVTAVSSNDVWAVGDVLLHWNGSEWSLAPGPGPDGYLSGAFAISTNDVWAVGSQRINIGPFETLTMHWDGSAWNEVPSANLSSEVNALLGVGAASSTEVWSVGQENNSSEPFARTLVEKYVPVPDPRFTDVCPTNYFYQHVLELSDDNILSGYNTVPPCDDPSQSPCFKPYNWTTRGQIAKVVSMAAGFTEPISTQTFEDVPTAHTFYEYIERMAARSIIGGYPCGGSVEPCGADNKPYFRPGNSVSRGQLSKMAALAFGFTEPVTSHSFLDVPISSTFYEPIERLAVRRIVNGYPCGTVNEPCVPDEPPHYFRPANNVSRGQVAKIVNLARLYVGPTPTITPTPTGTPNPTATNP
jgi:hypothetical protein